MSAMRSVVVLSNGERFTSTWHPQQVAAQAGSTRFLEIDLDPERPSYQEASHAWVNTSQILVILPAPE